MESETLWRITAAVVPVSFGLGLWLMNRPEAASRTVAGLCFGFAGTWLGVMGFMWLMHTPTSLPYRIVAGLGIGAFVFVIVPLLTRMAWPPDAQAQNQSPPTGQPPIVNQGPGSALSFGQQGGITAGTVNIGPSKRTLSDPRANTLKTQMLSDLPKDKPITVMALLGDSEAADFAVEIHSFLKQNGFTMKEPDGISQAVFTGSPKGVSLRPEANGELTLIVGAAK